MRDLVSPVCGIKKIFKGVKTSIGPQCPLYLTSLNTVQYIVKLIQERAQDLVEMAKYGDCLLYPALQLLYFIIVTWTALYCIALHYSTLHSTVDYCTKLRYLTLHCLTLYCTTLHYTILHYTGLHYLATHCKLLHYTERQNPAPKGDLMAQ